MRKDMNKVLTERPRAGGQGKKNVYDHKMKPRETRFVNGVKVDLSPKRESMRRRHKATGNEKQFTDLLGPLRRFLLSRVGQPWSKVWSEICQVLKGNSMQAYHVKDHVKWYVGGVPHTGRTYFRHEDYYNPNDGIVYVDEHGILRESNPPGWRRRKVQVYEHVYESNRVEYHKINGCWFRLELIPYQLPDYFRADGTRVPGQWTDRLDKRALSRREARRLDLNNRLATRPPNLKP